MKLLATLLLALPLAAFELWEHTGGVHGWLEAHFDVVRGRYEVAVLGLPTPWRPEWERLLGERYGIKVRVVAGCGVSERVLAYADAYNRVSVQAANRKFGVDVFHGLTDEAARAWAQAHPKRRE